MKISGIDFSVITRNARREGNNDFQPRILYLVKFSIMLKGKKRHFQIPKNPNSSSLRNLLGGYIPKNKGIKERMMREILRTQQASRTCSPDWSRKVGSRRQVLSKRYKYRSEERNSDTKPNIARKKQRQL